MYFAPHYPLLTKTKTSSFKPHTNAKKAVHSPAGSGGSTTRFSVLLIQDSISHVLPRTGIEFSTITVVPQCSIIQERKFWKLGLVCDDEWSLSLNGSVQWIHSSQSSNRPIPKYCRKWTTPSSAVSLYQHYSKSVDMRRKSSAKFIFFWASSGLSFVIPGAVHVSPSKILSLVLNPELWPDTWFRRPFLAAKLPLHTEKINELEFLYCSAHFATLLQLLGTLKTIAELL